MPANLDQMILGYKENAPYELDIPIEKLTDPGRNKIPLNSFMLFRKNLNKQLKHLKYKTGVLSKVASKSYANLSDEQKRFFKILAFYATKKHKLLHST